MSIGEPRDCSSCHHNRPPNEEYYGGGLINFSLEDISRRLKVLEDAMKPKQIPSVLDCASCIPPVVFPSVVIPDAVGVDDEDIHYPYPEEETDAWGDPVPKEGSTWVTTRLITLEEAIFKARDLLDAAVSMVDDDSVGGCVAQLLKRSARILQEVCPNEE